MFRVQADLCTACGTCVEICPVEAIAIVQGHAQIDQELCTECGACVQACPEGAIGALPEPAQFRTTPSQEANAPSEEAPTGEIIRVRLPPPPVEAERVSPPVEVEPAPPLAEAIQQAHRIDVASAVGTTLAFLGREVLPRLGRWAIDWLDDRLTGPSATTSVQRRRETPPERTGRGGRASSGRGGRRQRRRRHRGRRD